MLWQFDDDINRLLDPFFRNKHEKLSWSRGEDTQNGAQTSHTDTNRHIGVCIESLHN